MTKEEVKKYMTEFEVGWPLKVFKPEFILDTHVSLESYSLKSLTVMTLLIKNAFDSSNNSEVPLYTSLQIAESLDLKSLKEDKDVWSLQRKLLKAFMGHEVDESIKIKGLKVYDPHSRKRQKLK